MTTVINCKKTERSTKHKKILKDNFRKKDSNTKQRTLDFKLTLLRQELKATCKKSKTQKRNQEKKSINRKFINNPKGLYQDFKCNNIRLEEIPAKDKTPIVLAKISAKERSNSIKVQIG